MSKQIEETPITSISKGQATQAEKRQTIIYYFTVVILPILTLGTAIFEITILSRQTKLMFNQNEIMGKQYLIDTLQAKLASNQNDLTQDQNVMFNKQNDLFDNQNALVLKQNDLLDVQNDRVTQQNQLIEAQRRSSYVFMLGNIMEAVNDELNMSYNVNRRLSKQLVGQIIAFTGSLIPYRFMINDTLTKEPLSPEKGLLLSFLLESAICSKDLNSILENVQFNSCYAKDLRFFYDTINSIHLSGSRFQTVYMGFSRVNRVNCSDCEINYFFIGDGQYSDLEFVNLDTVNYLSVSNSFLINTKFDCSKIMYVQLMGSIAKGVSFLTGEIGILLVGSSLVKDINVEAGNIDSLILDRSTVYGNSLINTTKSTYKLEYDTYSMGHNTWKKDIPLASTIEYFLMQNSNIINLQSFSSIDTVHVLGSCFSSEVTAQFDLEHLLIECSIISTSSLYSNTTVSDQSMMMKIPGTLQADYSIYRNSGNCIDFDKFIDFCIEFNPEDKMLKDWREENKVVK